MKVLTIVSLLCLTAFAVQAQVPKDIKPPKGFEEGTETRLTPEQLKAIEPWATNSMIKLQDLLEETKSYGGQKALDEFLKSFEEISTASDGKPNELLMRYVLHRGLKIAKIVKAQIANTNRLAIEQTARILRMSAEMAIEYYEHDYQFVNGKGVLKYNTTREIDFTSFATDYAIFLMGIQESMVDISAQHNIARLAIGLYRYDFSRDANRLTPSSPMIARLGETLNKTTEDVKDDDPKYLFEIYKMRTDFLWVTNYLKDPKNGFALEMRFSALSKEQRDRKLLKGERVAIQEGNDDKKWSKESGKVGTITKISGNSAEVYVEGDEALKVYPKDYLYPSVNCWNNICPPTMIHDYQCEIGEVKEVFSNGMAKIYYQKHKQSWVLKIVNGIPFSMQYWHERGRECDI